jgi:hypothetical protein
MKKILILLLIAASVPSFAQNSIWLEKGKCDALVVAEFKDSHDDVFNYIYVESDFSKHNDTRSTYVLASRDQKWWDTPVWIHAEIRSFVGKDFSTDNVFLIGPNTELINNKYGFINLQMMYRYDGHSNCQITVLSDWEYSRFLYSMYADFYGYDKTYMHTENRFFFKVIPHVRIGANLVLTSGEISSGFDFKPMGVLRIDL